jgi:hypothetical protein
MQTIAELRALRDSGSISPDEYSKRLVPLVDAIAGVKKASKFNININILIYFY